MNMWSLRCLKPERVPSLTRPDIFLLKGEEVSASGGCLVLWSQKVCGQIFRIGASVDDKSARFLSAAWPTVGYQRIHILAGI
jgi:hypothetical protein